MRKTYYIWYLTSLLYYLLGLTKGITTKKFSHFLNMGRVQIHHRYREHTIKTGRGRNHIPAPTCLLL